MDNQQSEFGEETYQGLFGLKKRSEIAYVDGLVRGLAAADRALLPKEAPHPHVHEIAMGSSSVLALVSIVEKTDGQARLDAIDALSHIFLYEKPSTDVLRRLRRVLNQAGVTWGDDVVVALVAKTLAIGGDEDLLRRQMSLLNDDDPGIVATAARLLGFGRYAPAVPLLNALVSPFRAFESRTVIWALGEIGDDKALPILGYALASGFRTVDCMIAMGKIGDISSVPRLLPMLGVGLPEQREAAYRALAMVFDRNRTLIKKLDGFRVDLSKMIEGQLEAVDADLSAGARFAATLCLARLGARLEPARVRRLLALPLEDERKTGVQAFFTKK